MKWLIVNYKLHTTRNMKLSAPFLIHFFQSRPKLFADNCNFKDLKDSFIRLDYLWNLEVQPEGTVTT